MTDAARRLRNFLDANVLFSAARHADAGLRALWQSQGIVRLTSHYAAQKAERNLPDSVQRHRLGELLLAVQWADDGIGSVLPSEFAALRAKDARLSPLRCLAVRISWPRATCATLEPTSA